MSTIRVNTNFNIDVEFEAAPFHKRLFAWIIDVIVLIIYFYIAVQLLSSVRFSWDDTAYNAFFMVLAIPFMTYHLICEMLMKGQSVGKKIMDIRVVTENGSVPGTGQYVIRWMIRTSDYMIFLIYLYGPSEENTEGLLFFLRIFVPFGLLVLDIILVNSKKQQRLGDILAHTIVINASSKSDISDTVFLEVGENYTPSFPQVMRLSDRDINSLKGILDTARKRHDYDLAEMASEKIKRHLGIETSLSPYDFLEILLKDYNYLSSH